MTKKELSQLYWLNREIEEQQRRLSELESLATSLYQPYNGNARAVLMLAIQWQNTRQRLLIYGNF